MVQTRKAEGNWQTLFNIVSIDEDYHITQHRFDPEFDNMDGFPSEAHDFMEWILVTNGDFEITVDGETEKHSLQKQPLLIVIRPGEVHSLKPLS